MITITKLTLLYSIAAIYLAATIYSLISQKKPKNALGIQDLITSINNKGGGWIILIPFVSLAALFYNFFVTIFWFIGVLFEFVAWLFKWLWNEVIVAGGYFLFSIIWHYLIKWPWKLLLLAFGKLLDSMRLNYLVIGASSIFLSLIIMFLGRFLQLLLNTGSWITYLFGILAIIPIGAGLSRIIQINTGNSKGVSRKFITHISYIIVTLLAIVVAQGLIVYIGSLTSFSSIFSSILAAGNLLGSALVIMNSILIIFCLGALPSFSAQYEGEGINIIKDFSKYLINHNWAKYLVAVPSMLIPIIIACLIPYFLTQGVSHFAGKASDSVFDVRLSQLNETQSSIPVYNYTEWLDVKNTSDDSLKAWRRRDLNRVKASLGILNTESTKAYLKTFYDIHNSEYGAAPVGAMSYAFTKFFNVENDAIKTTPFSPLVTIVDTIILNGLNSKIIPQKIGDIKSIEDKISELNQELALVCDSTKSNNANKTPEKKVEAQQPAVKDEKKIDRCELERTRINNQLSNEKENKILAEKGLARAKDVSAHLAEVYKTENSSNSNSTGSSKIAFFFVSFWLCLLLGIAFSPVIPIFAQVNHSIFSENDNGELFIMNRIKSSAAANPNQPLLGTTIFIFLLLIQPFYNIPGTNKIKDHLPSLENIKSIFSRSGFNFEKDANDVAKIDTTINEQRIDTSTVQALSTQSEVVTPSTEEILLNVDQVDEKPEYIGSSFSYNDNIHSENGAPDERYEVRVSYVVEVDGSISNLITSTNNGYGMEDEIIRAIMSTNREWNSAKKDGMNVRCLVESTFNFPQDK